jgi:HPr kinase/phosphorylase
MTEPAGAAGGRLVLHATCVALGDKGVLLLGPPGSGKSDLALRLIDRPGCGIGAGDIAARLVADDQVVLTRDGDGLIASAPDNLAGLLEIRGLGIVHVEPAGPVRLAMAVVLGPAGDIERYPVESLKTPFLGCPVASVAIDPAAASAPARVRAALIHLAKAAPTT